MEILSISEGETGMHALGKVVFVLDVLGDAILANLLPQIKKNLAVRKIAVFLVDKGNV